MNDILRNHDSELKKYAESKNLDYTDYNMKLFVACKYFKEKKQTDLLEIYIDNFDNYIVLIKEAKKLDTDTIKTCLKMWKTLTDLEINVLKNELNKRANKKRVIDLRVLGYSTTSNINTINIHTELLKKFHKIY